MVVVEPDAVDLEVAKRLTKGGHACLPVAGMGRADSLPALGRRARLAVRANGCRVGVVLEVRGVVHRVELGEDLAPCRLSQSDARGIEPARADPDGIDAIVGQALVSVEDLGRHASVNAPDLNPGSRLGGFPCAGGRDPAEPETHEGDDQDGAEVDQLCPIISTSPIPLAVREPS